MRKRLFSNLRKKGIVPKIGDFHIQLSFFTDFIISHSNKLILVVANILLIFLI